MTEHHVDDGCAAVFGRTGRVLDRAVARAQRREAAADTDPCRHTIRLKRQAIALAFRLLDAVQEEHAHAR